MCGAGQQFLANDPIAGAGKGIAGNAITTGLMHLIGGDPDGKGLSAKRSVIGGVSTGSVGGSHDGWLVGVGLVGAY